MESEDEMQDAWAGTSDDEFQNEEEEDEDSDALASDDEDDESDYGFGFNDFQLSTRRPQVFFKFQWQIL